MPAVPYLSRINEMMSATGCTQAEADLALRRVGYGADAEQLREAIRLEQAISAASENGIDPALALEEANETALAA